MRAEHFVILGALICVAPVVFGLIVAKWDRRWSRSGETLIPHRGLEMKARNGRLVYVRETGSDRPL